MFCVPYSPPNFFIILYNISTRKSIVCNTYKLQCRGKVYLGISKEERRIIEAFAKNNRVSKPWFAKYRNAVWLKPELVGTAHFMHETQNGGMRQPVWKGLREDK